MGGKNNCIHEFLYIPAQYKLYKTNYIYTYDIFPLI